MRDQSTAVGTCDAIWAQARQIMKDTHALRVTITVAFEDDQTLTVEEIAPGASTKIRSETTEMEDRTPWAI